MDGRLDTSQLFTALREQVRNNLPSFITAVVCLLPVLFADNYMKTKAASSFSAMISLFAQYYITRTALMRAGVMIDGVGNKFFSFWGMNIISPPHPVRFRVARDPGPLFGSPLVRC